MPSVVSSKCAAHWCVLESGARSGPKRIARAGGCRSLPDDTQNLRRAQGWSVQHRGTGRVL